MDGATQTNKHSNAIEQLTALPHTKRELSRLKKRYPGVPSKVAKDLGFRRSTICNVLAGRDASAKIAAALVAEYNRRISEELNKQSENAA